MQPSAFDEENAVLDAPPRIECDCLSVWRGLDTNGVPIVISCWKPSKDELAEIVATGRVWLVVLGETMPPVCVTGEHPFE